MMRRAVLATVVAAACMALAGCAQTAPAANCPQDAADMTTQSLYGSWEATIEGQDGMATMKLHRHPEYEGVQGTLERAGQTPAQLAGDIDPQGQLALDESQDGKSISASWAGSLQPGSCGKEFRGEWYRSADDSKHPFVLRRAGSWQ